MAGQGRADRYPVVPHRTTRRAARALVQARGLALLGAVPCFGSVGVYMNWAKIDPWFTVRMIFHGYHPNSAVSHPELTRRAFFGSAFPASAVIAFQLQMCRFESFWWPITMMRPFATAQAVLSGIASTAKTQVLVMAGSQDALMTPNVTRQTAAFYRSASSSDDNVHMELVEGAGHHLQNDVQWEDGAEKLLAFHRQL